MAVFGNSTSQKHSILAGYQRRANQMKARSTSKFNTANLGNVADSINDGYNNRFTKPYGDSKVLQDKVKTWHDYSVNQVKTANDRLAQAYNRMSSLKSKRTEMKIIDEQVQDAQIQIGKGDNTNINILGKLILSGQKIDKNYNGSNGATVDRYLAGQIGAKVVKGTNTPWVNEAQGPFEWKVGSAQRDIDDARAAVREVEKVSDSVHLKEVEDFMVDGRLMRESKTALVVTPLTTILVGGLIAYGVYKFGSGNAIGFSGSNKSAAVAVFK